MVNGYDVAYAAGLAAAAPVWLLKPSARRKVLGALRDRTGKSLPPRDLSRPAVMIHAVSLGEMNATRAMVSELAAKRPELQFVVSSTTETGYARGRELYGANADVLVIRYPLDFSGAISRVLDGLRVSAVALMELEVWPNFLGQCVKRAIPAVLVNGRLTDASFRRYRRLGPVSAGMFRKLSMVCAQDRTYADRFIALGAPSARVKVTGTMKFDTAAVADRISGDAELAAAVGLAPGEPVLVAGSTGPGEEEMVLEAYRELRQTVAGLRLAIVPRHPQRFDDVAKLIEGKGFAVVRRSTAGGQAVAGTVVLGDTMGELRKFYSLATVVFVGRSLVDLGPRQHGSDMIEPAALGKPVVVGPYTTNFAEVMNAFRRNDAIREVKTPAELKEAVNRLLADGRVAAEMGRRAQETVRQEQGATARHVAVILDAMAQGPHVA